MRSTIEEMEESVEMLLCKAERLLRADEKLDGDDDQEKLLRFAAAAHAAKAAAERHPALARKFGQNIPSEEIMEEIEEWGRGYKKD